MQEKWHQVEKGSRRESPSVRLKCQYESVDILPLRDYEEFLYYLKVPSCYRVAVGRGKGFADINL